MQSFPLTFTARQYDPDLGYLRKAIVLDRSSKLSEVVADDGYGSTVRLFIDHKSLYIVGIDFGQGRYRLPDDSTPPLPNAKDFEFGGNYNDLGLHSENVEVNAGLLSGSISSLASHRVGNKGSEFLLRHKQSLIRLIFAVSEALRFWEIQRAVSGVLADYSKSVTVNDWAGSGKHLNNWSKWSSGPDWANRGVFVPAI